MVYVKAFLLFPAETAAFPLEETNSQATPKGLILKECTKIISGRSKSITVISSECWMQLFLSQIELIGLGDLLV